MVGSLAVLGCAGEVPPRMAASIDVDYARMEPRDREWIRHGLRAGVLSLAILTGRFAETSFLDEDEAARARRALEEDRRWLRAKGAQPRRRVQAGVALP